MELNTPTPYSDVNEILDLLMREAKEILQDELIGMYLHGSLANGGFDRGSDIDVVMLTQNELEENAFLKLQNLHTKIGNIHSPWSTQLEVAYISLNALRQPQPPDISYPHIDRGRGEVLHRIRPESDWPILRHVLRERGICISGPEPKALIEAVHPDDLRQAVVDGVPVWFPPILSNPAELAKRGLQSFFVLSICRMLYTLRHGEILSKQAAADWAKESLDSKWKLVIDRALAGRLEPDTDAQPEDIQATLEMMRYMLEQIQPTAFPEVNHVLLLLLSHVKEILGELFIGMYLYGSLSSGDFDPVTSDIDFLVVTNEILPPDMINALRTMHEQLWAGGMKWTTTLEGSYVPKDLIRRHDPNGVPCPTVNEQAFFVDRRGSDWIIQRHVIREVGVIVEGPDPKTLIDPVTPHDIRTAVQGILEEWWFPMLKDSSWLKDHGSPYHAFAVISMCRALHALEHGTIVSKPAAVRWARERVESTWQELIDRAVVSQSGNQSGFLDETLAFIRFIKSTLEPAV